MSWIVNIPTCLNVYSSIDSHDVETAYIGFKCNVVYVNNGFYY